MVIRRLNGVIVFMTVNTTEGRVVARCRVTFGTLVPFALMFPAVNREIEVVVIPG